MDQKKYAKQVLTAAIEGSGWMPRKEGDRPPAVLVESLRRQMASSKDVFAHCVCYGVPADEAARRIRLADHTRWSS